MSGNIQNCCRICLDVVSKHIPILGDSTVHLHMKSCLGMCVSANDELPKEICLSCAAQLNDFYNFQLNARCSLDWLETTLQENTKKSTESKAHIQPLPDSEYNSDSLLEFLNNTANIEEYLNNLGKEDIPSIVSMLDRNQENSVDSVNKTGALIKHLKHPSPIKKEQAAIPKNTKMKMEIDVLDSEADIVNELLLKETEPKKARNKLSCFACKIKFDNIQQQSQHLITCDTALRTCMHCNALFDSKVKMQEHSITHNKPFTCNCGKQFPSTEKLSQHHKTCYHDYGTMLSYIYRCKQCGQIFKERFEMYRHAKEHVLKAEMRICDVCGHGFVGNDALAKHRKKEHNMGEGLFYRCKICRHTSQNYKEMYLHVQKHTAKLEPERHLCETCGRSFTTTTSLTRHVLLHKKGDKSVSPKIQTEKRNEDLRNVETVMCERCGQNVNSLRLKDHMCV